MDFLKLHINDDFSGHNNWITEMNSPSYSVAIMQLIKSIHTSDCKQGCGFNYHIRQDKAQCRVSPLITQCIKFWRWAEKAYLLCRIMLECKAVNKLWISFIKKHKEISLQEIWLVFLKCFRICFIIISIIVISIKDL